MCVRENTGLTRAPRLRAQASSAGSSSQGARFPLIDDPHIKFTTTPRNLGKVVEFLVETETVKERPASWKDLTFPNLHTSQGS
jgi:NitT/TauT family transport system substrate-binding protein